MPMPVMITLLSMCGVGALLPFLAAKLFDYIPVWLSIAMCRMGFLILVVFWIAFIFTACGF